MVVAQAAMLTKNEREALNRLRVAELFARYMVSQQAAKPAAAIRISHAWRHLQSTFALIRPAEITEELCLGYCNARHGAGASIGTINNELTYLRAALKFAYRNRWIDTEPRVPVPRRPRIKSRKLTILQMRQLLAAASMPHLRLFIALTILTQSRPKDLLALKWTDVDLGRCVLKGRDGRGRITVTSFSQAARKWLVRAYEVSKSDFVIEWGDQQVVEIKRGFQMTAKRAGIVCTPMMLYRSAAELAAKSSPSIISLGTEDTLDSIVPQLASLNEDESDLMNEVRQQAQRNGQDAF
jgi:integrase